jgi:hypothetical protein
MKWNDAAMQILNSRKMMESLGVVSRECDNEAARRTRNNGKRISVKRTAGLGRTHQKILERRQPDSK